MLEISKVFGNLEITKRLGYRGNRGFDKSAKSQIVDGSVVTFLSQYNIKESTAAGLSFAKGKGSC